MRIIEYNTARADTLDELDEIVENSLKINWQPLGGVSFDPSVHGYIQAMVKYESSDAELKPKLVTDKDLGDITAGFTHAIWKEDSIANVEPLSGINNKIRLDNFNELEKEFWKVREENERLRKEIDYLKHKLDSDALLISELKTENENLKYKLYGNSTLIESLQKENALLKERSKPRDDALLTAINENEILKQIAVDLIHAYSRHHENEGYFVILEGNDYYSKSFNFQGDQILKQIIEHRKKLNEINN